MHNVHTSASADTSNRERMYKSRLHQWGLDKKKKEHEMLEVIRVGFNRKDLNKDSVFQIRGRPVTLGDALHYFSRKGIKDPQTLLDTASEPESASDADVSTPTDAPSLANLPGKHADQNEDESPLDSSSVMSDNVSIATMEMTRSLDKYSLQQVVELRTWLQAIGYTDSSPARVTIVELSMPRELQSPQEYRCMEAMLMQTRLHFKHIFSSRQLCVTSSSWSATSDDGLSDRFYIEMYHGYSSLWNGQNDIAFQQFDQAFGLIRKLVTEEHVPFLIYVYDLVIRYEESGKQVILLKLLHYLSEMARTTCSENHPLRWIATWMIEADSIRSVLASFMLRRILDLFQDSIGYFHQETIALLQTFAWSLVNREEYDEAAIRFEQLARAFETAVGKDSYEVCYAIRATAEAHFLKGSYNRSLEIIQEALVRSVDLPREQKVEIQARCLRHMAEVSKKLGKTEEAEELMQQCVDCCKDTFGTGHPFVERALMHQKSLRINEWTKKPAMPPMVHRLGKGGSAAKHIFASRAALAQD